MTAGVERRASGACARLEYLMRLARYEAAIHSVIFASQLAGPRSMR